MHTLKITGDTPEALYFNVVKTLSMFLQGASTPMAPLGDSRRTTAAPAADIIPPSDNGSSAVETRHDGSTPSGGTTTEKLDTSTYAIEAAFAKPKGNRKTRAKVEKMENDDISDVGAGKTIEHDAGETVAGKKPLTLEADIIPRLQAIQAACTKRGMEMPACVQYIQRLYKPFAIANAKHLVPAQYERFLEASEAYLNGDA